MEKVKRTIKEMLEAVGHLKKVEKLERMSEYNWIDSYEFYDLLLNAYNEYLKENGYDPKKPPVILPARQEDWEGGYDISFGQSLDGTGIGLKLSDLRRGGIVCLGKPGSGKTILSIYLAMQLENIPDVYSWFFETSKLSFRDLPCNRTIIVPHRLFCWNKWREPKNINPVEYHGLLVDVVADTHGLLAKGRALLQTCVDELDAQFGVGRGSPFRWSDLDILQKMIEKRKQTKSIDERETYSRWIERLGPYEKYSDLLGAGKSFDLTEMMKQNVVWEFTGLPRTVQCDLISSMLLFKFVFKRNSPEETAKTLVNFIDEATNLVSEDEISLTRSFVFSSMRLFREYGECYVINVQQPERLKDILTLAHAVVIMQQSGFSIPFFLKNTAMTREQACYLENLPVGRGVVSMPEKPLVEVDVPYHPIEKRRTNEEIEEEMAPVLEQFLVESPRGVYKASPEVHHEGGRFQERTVRINATPDERKAWEDILHYIADNRLSGVAEVYDACGFSVEYSMRQMDSLTKLSYLEGPVDLPTRAGRWKKVYILTKKGADLIGADWDRVRFRGKGTPMSKVYARIVYEWIQRNGGKPFFEFALTREGTRKACDVADISDAYVAFELQTGTAHLVPNIVKNHSVGFEKTVVVAKNDRERKKLEREAEKKLDSSYDVEFRVIRSFL